MMYPWVKSKIDIPICAPLKQISFFEKISDLIDAKSPALDTDMIPFISPPNKDIKGLFVFNLKEIDNPFSVHKMFPSQKVPNI